MSAARLRLRRGLVTFVALWPLVTIALAFGWETDPWKFFGFGMYATPIRDTKDVEFTVLVPATDGSPTPTVNFEGDRWVRVGVENPRVKEALVRYVEWRRSAGRLAEPHDLAREVMAATGQTRVRVLVYTARLDAASATIKQWADVYGYDPGHASRYRVDADSPAPGAREPSRP